MSVKFLLFRGGLGGGGSADFIFMGARIFLILGTPRKDFMGPKVHFGSRK